MVSTLYSSEPIERVRQVTIQVTLMLLSLQARERRKKVWLNLSDVILGKGHQLNLLALLLGN
jgi:uncharacterized membrane protein YhfC